MNRTVLSLLLTFSSVLAFSSVLTANSASHPQPRYFAKRW